MKRGFSLLEVLVAFVILAAALSVLLPAMTGMTRRAAIVEQRWTATELARSKMAAIGISVPLEAGVNSGEWNGLTWQTLITPTAARSSEPMGQLVMVEVRIERASDGAELAALRTLKRRR